MHDPRHGRRSTMAGTVEVYKDKTDTYRWRSKASNGEIIAAGEAYESKSAARAGIESVRRYAADATVVEQD
jgi:uncharacterized protein YegP (UPF0339 family)